MSELSIRPLDAGDVDLVQWALYTAVSWSGDPNIPPLEVAVEHPEMQMYHAGWGRPGDIGAAAHIGSEFVGAAFARLFTEELHGHGFVDGATPELGIGVKTSHRGQGIGGKLMDALADVARAQGIERLSLSVNNPNPAKRLYEALGYQTLEDDGDSTTMLLDLA